MLLTADGINGFTQAVLASRYDEPKVVPDCHLEWWEMVCSPHPQVAIAAPRGHAKSTAITFAYVLANLLFRQSHHILILSANEDLASAFVNDIKVEFHENEVLAEMFGFEKFLKESETELIGQFRDKSRFRVIAKGAGQRMRGMKWERKRPDLVIGDDLEDDEIVLNQSRREKFKRWFYGAVIPIIKDGGLIRIVGTIVHMDSLLENLMPTEKMEGLSVRSEGSWLSAKYRAHNEDFSEILWPEQFSKESLKRKRADFAARGILDVYGQEYLNDPIDLSTAYFKEEDFLELKEANRQHYAAIDFAITQNQRSDYTAIVVGGVTPDGTLDIVHARKGRWDAKEIIENMIQVQRRFDIDLFFAEDGAIKKSIGPFLNDAMRREGVYINLQTMTPTKDKESRARSLQARMRAGGVRFNTEAEWYLDLHEEMIRFPKAKHDDLVDAMAWLGLGMDEQITALTPEEEAEEEYYDQMFQESGRSSVTGY